MGENEQGGMLRVVTVLGLIAIIAAVVIFAVTGLKGKASNNRDAALYAIQKVPKSFDNLNGGNVSISSYPFNGIKDGQWNGVFFPIQVNDKIPPGYWRKISIGIKPEQDSTVQVDVNNYDLDNPKWDHRNDNDEWGERDFKLYENVKLVGSLGWGKTPVRMQAGHSYELVLKYHNTSKYTLYDTMNKETDWLRNGISDLMLGTTDGSAGKYNISDSEYATYKLPADE